MVTRTEVTASVSRFANVFCIAHLARVKGCLSYLSSNLLILNTNVKTFKQIQHYAHLFNHILSKKCLPGSLCCGVIR